MVDVVRAGTSSLRMRMMDGGVLLLEMSGLLTAKALAEFAGRAVRAHGHDAVGFVLDYRKGVVLATPHEMGLLVDALPPGSPITRPGAFVTTESNVLLMRDHAVRMAQRGMWRKTFYSVDLAAGWVRIKASGA